MSFSFLLASWGTSGNLTPLLTAGRRLHEAGHSVRVIADPAKRTEIETAGFAFVAWRRAPIGPEADPVDVQDSQDFYQRVIFGPILLYAADIREEIERVPTDAVLAIAVLYGVALGAEAAGVGFAMLSPHISARPLTGLPPIGSGMKPPKTPEERAEVEAEVKRFADSLNDFLPDLNQARISLGLPIFDHIFDIYDRSGRMLLGVSQAFDFDADEVPDNVRYIGPLLDQPAWSQPWDSSWPTESCRPRALISFSTGAQKQADIVQRVVNAMGAVEIDAVVTTGPSLDVKAVKPPRNVRVFSGAPHDVVMKEVSLMVAHGGHGTVNRALVHGLPLLIMPDGRDQNDNALRVEARGAGLVLPSTASEEEIAAAVNRLISEPHFRVAARQLGAAIAADCSSSRLVDEMESIVVERRKARRSASSSLVDEMGGLGHAPLLA
jgi:UDP:flavonoid glycosyltransferase YjiC (YdhE family)